VSHRGSTTSRAGLRSTILPTGILSNTYGASILWDCEENLVVRRCAAGRGSRAEALRRAPAMERLAIGADGRGASCWFSMEEVGALEREGLGAWRTETRRRAPVTEEQGGCRVREENRGVMGGEEPSWRRVLASCA
jgi:hypothetical protein